MKNALRNPLFRKKLLDTELFPSPVTTFKLRQLTGKTDKGAQLYSPHDIRKAKLGLASAGEAPLKLARPPIILFRIIKGGTGKTNCTGNLATALAFMGYRVLCIDGDPQASLTRLLGVHSPDVGENHIGTAMRRFYETKQLPPELLQNLTIPIFSDGMLDLIPANLRMAQINVWLTSILGGAGLFNKIVDSNLEFFGQYDVILIDSAPSYDLISFSFMAASTAIFAPVELDYEAKDAFSLLLENLMELQDVYPDVKPRVELLINGLRENLTHSQPLLEMLGNLFADYICPVYIHYAVAFLRQTATLIPDPEESGTLLEKEPTSPSVKTFFSLARHIAARYRLRIANDPSTELPRVFESRPDYEKAPSAINEANI